MDEPDAHGQDRDGTAVHRLVVSPMLVEVLSALVGDVLGLHRDPPADGDAFWDRLYPATSSTTADDAEIRELVHPDVVDGRIEALETVAMHLEDVVEDDEGAVLLFDDVQCALLVGAVNDIRIGLATKVDAEVYTSADREWPPANLSRSQALSLQLLHALGELQEVILGQLDPDSQDHYAAHDHDTDTVDDED